MVYIPPIPKTAEELTGHTCGCDCAVCDDFTFRQSLKKGFMSIEEVHEHEKMLRDELNEAQETAGRYYEDSRKMKAELDDALERIEKWKTWHDSASEDAKNWRRDAQELQGVLDGIKAELQSRNIHLLSKHCWCSPEGHSWLQKGTVAE